LSVMLIAAALLPVDVGANLTLNVRVLPGVTVAGRVPVIRMNSEALAPVRLAAETVRLAVPLLVITTGVLLLAVPTSWLANVTLGGATLNPGAIAVPESATECGLPVALSVSDSDADFEPELVGEKVTLMVVFAFGATVIGRVVLVSVN